MTMLGALRPKLWERTLRFLSSMTVQDAVRVSQLVRNFKDLGHTVARTDPLRLEETQRVCPELTAAHYGFTFADLCMIVPPDVLRASDALLPFSPWSPSASPPTMTLGELIESLERTYCGPIGFEYMHVQSREQLEWLRNKIETPPPRYSIETRLLVLKGLVKSTCFEEFLERAWPSQKRFANTGGEVFVPGIMRLLEQLSYFGAEKVFLGTYHRGRLAQLHCISGKPKEELFSSFMPEGPNDQYDNGDLEPVMGYRSAHEFAHGGKLSLKMLYNPAHLESVNPVVLGRTRAEQDLTGDLARKKVVPIIVHGDSAFAGQGVVYETLGLADLQNYTVGGTINVIINNQIGYTVQRKRLKNHLPNHPTNLALVLNAPVFHVNADDPEAVLRCMDMAAEFRQKFNRDVFVDLVCYRRFGHNELEDPMLTNPNMYQAIANHPTLLTTYGNKLVQEGIVSDVQLKAMIEADFDESKKCRANIPSYVFPEREYLDGRWKGFQRHIHDSLIAHTGFDEQQLSKILVELSTPPKEFALSPAVNKMISSRKASFEKESTLDWASAEMLAFAACLSEGIHVRLSGQDVQRGTFSQRHHIWHDQVTGIRYCPLQEAFKDRAPYVVSNSPLSEMGILGFEYGYSLCDPNALVIWEAQFGDFANMAQVAFDQFISTAEAKWGQWSGLVMLLPHGYEGMGPEHSSARIERFLQSSADHPLTYHPSQDNDMVRFQLEKCNWQIIHPSTPANFFHALRRQVKLTFRKPLIVFTPKSLLRLPEARSSVASFGPTTSFQRMYFEANTKIFKNPLTPNPDVKKLLLCSGKVYYDLMAERNKREVLNIAIARVEQLSPFPFDLVREHADHFPNASILWVQEEHKNQGAWSYVRPRLMAALRHSTCGSRGLSYVGRGPSASTATGDPNRHASELALLLESAFA